MNATFGAEDASMFLCVFQTAVICPHGNDKA